MMILNEATIRQLRGADDVYLSCSVHQHAHGLIPEVSDARLSTNRGDGWSRPFHRADIPEPQITVLRRGGFVPTGVNWQLHHLKRNHRWRAFVDSLEDMDEMEIIIDTNCGGGASNEAQVQVDTIIFRVVRTPEVIHDFLIDIATSSRARTSFSFVRGLYPEPEHLAERRTLPPPRPMTDEGTVTPAQQSA